MPLTGYRRSNRQCVSPTKPKMGTTSTLATAKTGWMLSEASLLSVATRLFWGESSIWSRGTRHPEWEPEPFKLHYARAQNGLRAYAKRLTRIRKMEAPKNELLTAYSIVIAQL